VHPSVEQVSRVVLQALTVGHQEFQLTATEDGKSGLAAFLHGFDAGSECTEIGSVMHKLHVQVVVQAASTRMACPLIKRLVAENDGQY
jgi:hypothetical protein